MSHPWLRIATFFFILAAGLRSGVVLADDEDYDLATFNARAGNMTAEALSADGRQLLTGEDDGAVTLWSIVSGTTLRTYKGHARPVTGAAMLPDGRRGVTCGDDGQLILWDLNGGKTLREISTGDSVPVTLSLHGDTAAAGCTDGEVQVWDLDNGKKITVLKHATPICGTAFSPDGRLLAAGYSDGKVILWNSHDWTEARVLDPGDGISVGAIAFSPNGKNIATGNQAGLGAVWDLQTGAVTTKFVSTLHPDEPLEPPAAPVFPGSTVTPEGRGAIVWLCYNGDGSTLLGSVQDAVPRFWDAKSGQLLGIGKWFYDNRFYVARYGFPFSVASLAPNRAFLATLKQNTEEQEKGVQAQVWRLVFKPVPAD